MVARFDRGRLGVGLRGRKRRGVGVRDEVHSPHQRVPKVGGSGVPIGQKTSVVGHGPTPAGAAAAAGLTVSMYITAREPRYGAE